MDARRGLDVGSAARSRTDEELIRLVAGALDVGSAVLAWSDADEGGRAGPLIGRVLGRHHDEIDLLVSVGHLEPDPLTDPGLTAGHPRWLLRRIDASLSASRAEQLAAVIIEAPTLELDGVVELMDRLVSAGKVARFGLGGHEAEELADLVGRWAGTHRPSVTRRHSSWASNNDEELTAAIIETELDLVASWAPPAPSRATEMLGDWCRHRGLPPLAAVALWLETSAAVGHALIDTCSVDELADWLTTVTVSDEDRAELDDIIGRLLDERSGAQARPRLADGNR